jgi:hypothetical protein
MLKERQRYKLPGSIPVEPGDSFTCSVSEKGKIYEFREKIGRNMMIDTIVTFDTDDNELGVAGIGAIFGEDKH